MAKRIRGNFADLTEEESTKLLELGLIYPGKEDGEGFLTYDMKPGVTNEQIFKALHAMREQKPTG